MFLFLFFNAIKWRLFFEFLTPRKIVFFAPLMQTTFVCKKTPPTSPTPPPPGTPFFQGATLGEVREGDEEVVSAADWVNRSRKKAVESEEERLLAMKRARYDI